MTSDDVWFLPSSKISKRDNSTRTLAREHPATLQTLCAGYLFVCWCYTLPLPLTRSGSCFLLRTDEYWTTSQQINLSIPSPSTYGRHGSNRIDSVRLCVVLRVFHQHHAVRSVAYGSKTSYGMHDDNADEEMPKEPALTVMTTSDDLLIHDNEKAWLLTMYWFLLLLQYLLLWTWWMAIFVEF